MVVSSRATPDHLRAATTSATWGQRIAYDEGGANWAIIASLLETCKLNAVKPYA